MGLTSTCYPRKLERPTPFPSRGRSGFYGIVARRGQCWAISAIGEALLWDWIGMPTLGQERRSRWRIAVFHLANRTLTFPPIRSNFRFWPKADVPAISEKGVFHAQLRCGTCAGNSCASSRTVLQTTQRAFRRLVSKSNSYNLTILLRTTTAWMQDDCREAGARAT